MKNRIITISGEPASGKSTVIKKIKEDYEKKGFKVHISTIGAEFRRIAKEKGLTIEEFNAYMMKRKGIDEFIDNEVAKQGKQINAESRPNELFIFDSRLAFHNIPDSFSVRLTVDDEIAGKRVFEDKNRGEEDKHQTLDDAIKNTSKRKKDEIARYKKRYGIDLQDENNYNLVIDTSYSTVKDIADVIETCLEYKMQLKTFSKLWASPKKMLPLQSELSTLRDGSQCSSIDEVIKSIKENGYKPDEEIDVIEVDGIKYIIEGHHRNFGAAVAGKTLIPYTIIAKDDEIVPYYSTSTTARQRAKTTSTYLYGHEWLIEKKGEKFSYNQIYPGIYDKLKKEEQGNNDQSR